MAIFESAGPVHITEGNRIQGPESTIINIIMYLVNFQTVAVSFQRVDFLLLFQHLLYQRIPKVYG